MYECICELIIPSNLCTWCHELAYMYNGVISANRMAVLMFMIITNNR